MSGSDDRQTTHKPCVETRASVEDWLDNLLDAGARTQVEAHLGVCPLCSEFFSRRRAITDDLLRLGRAADALACARAPKTALRILRWRAWFVGAATVLFFLSAGLYFSEFRHGRGPHAGVGEPAMSPSDPLEDSSPGISAPDHEFGMTCPADRMLVHMTSSNPRIHIVWLYEQIGLPETPANGENAQKPASSG